MYDPMGKVGRDVRACLWNEMAANGVYGNRSITNPWLEPFRECFAKHEAKCKRRCRADCMIERFKVRVDKLRWPSDEKIVSLDIV